MLKTLKEIEAETGIKGGRIRGAIARGKLTSHRIHDVLFVDDEEVRALSWERRKPTTGIRRISYSPVRKKYRIEIKRGTENVFFFETPSFEEAKQELEKLYKIHPEYRI